MSMLVIVRWCGGDGHEQRVTIHQNQHVSFGDDEFSDLQIHGNRSFRGKGFAIDTCASGCVVIPLAPVREPVSLNGDVIFGSASIVDGDVIAVCGVELHITVEGYRPLKVDELNTAGEGAVAGRNVASQLDSLRGMGSGYHCDSIVRGASACLVPMLLGNYRHAGMGVPEWVAEGGDLYEPYPEEVREIYSLHVIGGRELDELIAVGKELALRDAAVWCFSQKPWDELKEDLKFYLAWFARPSVLKMQFDQGGKELAHGIMNCLDALLLDLGNDDWVMYRNPSKNEPWEAFGFKGPIVGDLD